MSRPALPEGLDRAAPAPHFLETAPAGCYGGAMKTHQVLVVAGFALLLAACSSAPVQPALGTAFSDVPVPEGMDYQPDRSGVVEGPTVNVARLVYRGRLEIESLSASMRQGLETNGWKHVRTLKAANRTVIQSFEKPGSDLQISLWDGGWNYTYLDVTIGRVAQQQAAR